MRTESIKINYNNSEITIAAKMQLSGKTTIFFIHGLGCAKESFNKIWTYEKFKNFSMITFDLPGFGDSTRPVDFSYNLKDHANICIEIIKKLKLKNLTLVGHSMGGSIGILVAKKIPHMINSFICIEGNLSSSDCTISRKATALPYDNYKKRISSIILTLSSPEEKAGIKHWLECIERSDPMAFNQSSQSLVDWSDTGKLLMWFQEFKFYKKYFFGEKNKKLWILSHLNEQDKISIPRCGHFPMIDNPDDFYEELFLHVK